MTFALERDLKLQIPKHWTIRRLKQIAEVIPSNVDKLTVEGQAPVLLCNYVDTYKNERITSAIDFMKATATPAQIERLGLSKGDVTITKDSETPWDIAVPAVIDEDIHGLVCGYHLAKLSPNRDCMTGKFLAWALRAKPVNLQFALSAQGITRYGLGSSALRDGLLPCPPVPEQRAIASYLDAETARIDVLIDEKERLLKSLGELRTSRITEILTGSGLATRPSGNEWIPYCPEGWDVKRLKFLGQVRSGIAKGKKYDDGVATVELPYLRVANVQDGHLDLREILTIEVSEVEAQRYLLQSGDVLMNEGGDYDKLGRGAVWSGEVTPCIHQNHVFALRPDDPSLSSWISAITQTAYAKFYFMNNSKQSTNLASISQTNVKELPVLLPPRDVRTQLLSQMDDEFRRIDALSKHTRAEIELLNDLRAATITDAVLGRIDVRTWADNILATEAAV